MYFLCKIRLSWANKPNSGALALQSLNDFFRLIHIFIDFNAVTSVFVSVFNDPSFGFMFFLTFNCDF